MKFYVSTAQAKDYSDTAMQNAVDIHFAQLGIEGKITKDMHVVLKPNLLMKSTPNSAVITHPALVKAVILKLKSMGVSNITIADSPGGPYAKATLEGVYKASGLLAVAQETGAQLNYDTTFAVQRNDSNQTCKEFNIITPIIKADYIINLPKLKTHAMMAYSGAVKNMLGCVPGLQKPEFHLRFQQKDAFAGMLIDLVQIATPQLTIADAVVSMEGDGPSAGIPRQTGMTFASESVFALDMAMCEYAGIDFAKVHTICVAHQRGIAPTTTQQIEYIGQGKPKPVKPFILPKSHNIAFSSQLPVFLQKPAEKFIDRYLSPRPVIVKKDCIGCAKCAESCAPNAIDIVDKKAIINYSKCIRCFCCHEMCPVKAINIKRAKILGN